jgi:hypothetical protein
MTLAVRRATEADALSIASRLRDADRCEVLASGRLVSESLLAGVRDGPAFVWTLDQENKAVRARGKEQEAASSLPIVLFGVVPLSTRTGAIWLVGTPEMEAHQLPLLRQARRWVEALNNEWPLLANSADARNTLHHRFIRWCGFTFFAERSVRGLRFLDFARIKPTGGIHV